MNSDIFDGGIICLYKPRSMNRVWYLGIIFAYITRDTSSFQKIADSTIISITKQVNKNLNQFCNPTKTCNHLIAHGEYLGNNILVTRYTNTKVYLFLHTQPNNYDDYGFKIKYITQQMFHVCYTVMENI